MFTYIILFAGIIDNFHNNVLPLYVIYNVIVPGVTMTGLQSKPN